MVKLDHLAIPVSDRVKSRDWYVRNFGFKVEFEVADGGSWGRGVCAIQDDAGLTVFLDQTDEKILSGQANYTLQVDSVDELFERLSRLGVEFILSPAKHFFGYGAVLADPDGHRLQVWDEVSMAAHST
jgi:catechol 2,3-dioxygenase-like lactoylglutathione lyase family enzyme